ncbi:hypothetical protein GJ496_004993 [Pomphorhynchus laevis]|nr:hypothetical protein GJ496_004993 [Pomphorhynchus laevis]
MYIAGERDQRTNRIQAMKEVSLFDQNALIQYQIDPGYQHHLNQYSSRLSKLMTLAYDLQFINATTIREVFFYHFIGSARIEHIVEDFISLQNRYA